MTRQKGGFTVLAEKGLMLLLLCSAFAQTVTFDIDEDAAQQAGLSPEAIEDQVGAGITKDLLPRA